MGCRGIVAIFLAQIKSHDKAYLSWLNRRQLKHQSSAHKYQDMRITIIVAMLSWVRTRNHDRPMITHLEHKAPDQNCFRFYRMDVQRDLFGAWVLMRSWGRIGTLGRDRIDSFDNAQAARRAQEKLNAAKIRRGYAAVR